MAENQNLNFGELEKLALIADACQNVFTGKATMIFELKKEEYQRVILHFREIDRHHKQFSIDISGTEFHFILDEEEK